jgi:hypothetical protein
MGLAVRDSRVTGYEPLVDSLNCPTRMTGMSWPLEYAREHS